MEKGVNSQKRVSVPLANPLLQIEHDVYGMEYFHWPAQASCLAMLPPSSSTPIH